MKKEIMKIIITSLLSTILAILQAYAAAHAGDVMPAADPALAGTLGAGFTAATAKWRRA